RSAEGTGLGLALVKSIADLHGGSLNVASETGRGTSVTLKFPRP
ncbi:MAG: ATP-binding protein, partial [Chthoniobacterales bacterium]